MDNPEVYENPLKAHVIGVEKGIPMVITFLDEFQDGESFWLARCAETDPKTDFGSTEYQLRFHHLVLRRNPETGLYTRAGTRFMRTDEGWQITRQIFDGVPHSTIVLV